MTTNNAVSSNAFNAASFVSNGVDPRTGQYTVSVSLPALNGNQLCGPSLGLSLNFSPINTQDCGYGIGWDLPLSQYRPSTGVLSLSNGESFKVEGAGDTATIPEQKIETFKLYVEGADRYRVVHKSGLIEFLRHEGSSSSLVALPYELHSPQGHVLYLTYKPWNDGHRLDEVRQADGKLLLRVTKALNTVTINYLSGDETTVVANFTLELAGNQLRYLVLPSMDPADAGYWEFEYETVRNLTCMKRVRSPQGAEEHIEHLDEGHAYPGVNRPALPRVTRHVIAPGQGQVAIDARFEYSHHNFLGNGAPGLTFTDDGLDNLYRVNEPYDYYSVQTLWQGDTPGRSVKSLYNRYHLLTEQVTRNGNALKIMASEYHLDESLPFDLQVPQCQLPRKTIARWALANDPTRLFEEVTFSRFDTFGNPLEQIDETGVRQTWEYYSALGEEGCPADPYGFTRQIKEIRRYPAAALPARKRHSAPSRQRTRQRGTGTPVFNDEPVLISRFTYATHPPLEGGGVPTLVLQSKIDSALTPQGEQAVLRSTFTFIDAPSDPDRHGQPLTIVEHRPDDIATTTFTYDFAQSPGFLVSKQQEVHSLDGTESEVFNRVALYTGLLAETSTAEGQVIRYEYDPLQRVIAETVMPGHPNEAIRRYRYKWGTSTGQLTQYYEVDALGVETLSEIDGIGRTLRRSRQKADGSSEAGTFQLLYSAEYGHDMDVLKETHHDWLGDVELAVSQRYEYDEWDQCCRVIDSTGMASHTVSDPFTQTVTQWRDDGARTVTHNNRFGKPERIDVLDIDGIRQSRQRSFYDGYGQLRVSIGACGERSEYHYDVLGRATRNGLPDGTQLEHHYAPHSDALLVTRLQVTQGNRLLPRVLAGTQVFDGLARTTSSTNGQRTTRYLYSGSRSVADAQLTPSAKRIDYVYNLALSEAPVSITAEQEVTFEYHPVSAVLTKAQSSQGTREYQYDGAGHMSLERTVIDGQVRENHYLKSVAGRMRRREDFTGLVSEYRYDAHGRLDKINEGQLEARFDYNAQGLRSRTTTQDLTSANTLVTEIEYDTLGREVLRTQRMTRAAEHVTAQRWALSGQLRERELRVGGVLALLETFAYDQRGRLIEHHCSGPELPTDRYGNAISEQQFYFDSLDNLLFCTSHFADGSSDIAEHFYADDDSCQLRLITHTHPHYPAETHLEYDVDGHLLKDGDGRGLNYDRRGRLLAVTQPDGNLLARYRYDAHDSLIGVTQGADDETLRFYDGHQLRTTVQGEQRRSFSYDGGVPLGQQLQGQPDCTLLTLCGASQSVMAEVKGQDAVKTTRYTSHGVPSDPLDSQLGYNGEVREADTGWYLLGSGYRAYDPHLMRFHSPDSESPFGAGGINPYAYCLGNPIRYRDPTGHSARLTDADYRYELEKVAQQSATTSFLIGSGFLALGLSAVSGPVGWALFALDAAALVTRTVLEDYYIKTEQPGQPYIHVIDALTTMGVLYMQLPRPKRQLSLPARAGLAGDTISTGTIEKVPTVFTSEIGSIERPPKAFAAATETIEKAPTVITKGPSPKPRGRSNSTPRSWKPNEGVGAAVKVRPSPTPDGLIPSKNKNLEVSFKANPSYETYHIDEIASSVPSRTVDQDLLGMSDLDYMHFLMKEHKAVSAGIAEFKRNEKRVRYSNVIQALGFMY